MKKTSFFLVLTISLLFLACHKMDLQPQQKSTDAPANSGAAASSSAAATTSCAAPTVTTLVEADGTQVGTVSIRNNGAFYFITYTTLPGYKLKQTAIFIGSCDNLPVNKHGDVDFSQFQYIQKHIKDDTYTDTALVSDIGLGNCGCIIAYALVRQIHGEDNPIDTYGTGNPIRKSQAMSIPSCPCVDPPQD